MSAPRLLVAAFAGVAVLLSGAACQNGTPDPQGSTMQTQRMPDLPDDPGAATAVVRKMMMDEAIPLLKSSGLKYTDARFNVVDADDGKRNGELRIEFDGCTDAEVRTMTDVIWAHGWKQSNKLQGVHVRKGPLDLQWGKRYGGGSFVMVTDDVSQHLRYNNDVTKLPELASFKAQP